MQGKWLVVALFISSYLFAQTNQDYHPLKCTGTIPEDFRILSMDKFRKDVKDEIKNSKNHYVNKEKEEFLLKSNYIIDELLQSGKVLFNDSVTNYVNKVADNILINEPDLRAKLRFYCLKSSVTNAFSTNQGIIFVTLGLIAQLENEAQLAFILSHEISHWEKKHTINSYLENEKIFSGKGNYRYNSYDNKIRIISKYSKDLELEADSLGILRFLQTDYKPSEIMTVFDVLQFSYLPFGDIEFKPDFLSVNGKVKFPPRILLDSVTEIDFEKEGEDDSKSTHPNVRKRRERADEVLSAYKKKGSKAFMQPKELFMRIRTIARYESIQVDLSDRRYIEVIYNCLYLLEDNPQSKYLGTILAKALYGAAKYKGHYKYDAIAEEYGDIEGNSQKCYYFFKQLESEQLYAIAFRYLYDLNQKDKDPFIGRLATDLMKDLILKGNYTLTYIQNLLEPPKTDSTATGVKIDEKQEEPVDTTEGDSKYSKLRKQKKEWKEKKVDEVRSEDPIENRYHMMAFDGIYNTPAFMSMHALAAKLAEENKLTRKDDESRQSSYAYRYRAPKPKPKEEKKNLALGIDTMVVVDPFYFAADERKGLKLIDSESKLIGFTDDIKKCGQLSGLSVDMLAPKSFKENDVTRYNDLALMNEWMGERLDHGDMDMIHLQSDMMNSLTKRYNTRYFCYTGVISTKEIRDNRGYLLLVGCVLYPTLPIMAIIALTPINRTYYYTLVYDIESGQNLLTNKIELSVKSNSGYVNSVMYDQMIQMRKNPMKDNHAKK